MTRIGARYPSLAAAAVLSLAASSALAVPIPALQSFTDPAIFFSQDQSLGYLFTANSDITVTSLGFYDNLDNGFNAAHEVGIYSTGGTLLASVSLSSGTVHALIGDFRYAALGSSLNLLAGNDYYIVGTTLNDDWVFQAANIVTAPEVTYVQSYFFAPSDSAGGTIHFPNTLAAEREYMTVNFLFDQATATAVPEPGTLALLGVGLLALAGRHRRAS